MIKHSELSTPEFAAAGIVHVFETGKEHSWHAAPSAYSAENSPDRPQPADIRNEMRDHGRYLSRTHLFDRQHIIEDTFLDLVLD